MKSARDWSEEITDAILIRLPVVNKSAGMRQDLVRELFPVCLRVAQMSADLDDMRTRIIDNGIRLERIQDELGFTQAPAGNIGWQVPDFFPDDWGQ